MGEMAKQPVSTALNCVSYTKMLYTMADTVKIQSTKESKSHVCQVLKIKEVSSQLFKMSLYTTNYTNSILLL